MKLYYIPVISFYIFTFLKQFYILPSGSIGIGDMFLAASGVFLIIQTICSRKRFFYKIDIPWYELMDSITAITKMVSSFFLLFIGCMLLWPYGYSVRWPQNSSFLDLV